MKKITKVFMSIFDKGIYEKFYEQTEIVYQN